MHDCAPRSVAVQIRASCLYIKVYGFFCATLTDHPGRRNRSRVPARSQATMHGRKQRTTQLDSLRDTAASTALSRQFVYTTMAESGQLDAIRVGSGAVRWREQVAVDVIASRRLGGFELPAAAAMMRDIPELSDGRRQLGRPLDRAHLARSTSGSNAVTSAGADRPRVTGRVRLRSTEPEPRRPTEPEPHRSAESDSSQHLRPERPRRTGRGQQPPSTRSQQPRNQRSQRPRTIRSEQLRQRGTGQPQGRNRTELEAPNALTRSGQSSPRRTESPGGHGWLPRCICSEPAHAMSAHCVWRGGAALPLRTPTAARLSPARGRAGGVAPDPFSRWADG